MGTCCTSARPEYYQYEDDRGRESRFSGTPITRTLSDFDAGVAARHSAYLEMGSPFSRRKLDFADDDSDLEALKPYTAADSSSSSSGPRVSRKLSNRKSDRTLSILEEVESDVRYRFAFIVCGPGALDVVMGTCDSPGAVQLHQPGSSPSQDAREPLVSTSPSKSGGAYRCLCRIADAPLTTKLAPVLARLVFLPLDDASDITNCATHTEALNTVIAFTINLDCSGAKGDRIEDQLNGMAQAVRRMREHTRPRLRPVRAVILLGDKEKCKEESWASSLADYEEAEGRVWKFGPVDLQAKDALHAIFSEIASTRIANNRTGENGEEDCLYEEPDKEDLEQEEAETAELLQRNSFASMESLSTKLFLEREK